MLHRNIIIAESLRLRLRIEKYLIQILADINLGRRTGHLRQSLHRVLRALRKLLRVDSHLFHELGDQTVVNGQQRIQKVFLCHLLVAVFISERLASVDRFD